MTTEQRETEALRLTREYLRGNLLEGAVVLREGHPEITLGEYIDNALASAPAAPGEDGRTEESGWVIERGDSDVSQPLYYGGRNGWTYDNLLAVRFARKEDAESIDIIVQTLRATGKLPFIKNRIAEHGWS